MNKPSWKLFFIGILFLVLISASFLAGMYLGKKQSFDESEVFNQGAIFGAFTIINKTTYTGNVAYFLEDRVVETPIKVLCQNLNITGGTTNGV